LTPKAYLPLLQLYNRKLSSSAAVTSWSPLSSKVIPVMLLVLWVCCFGRPPCGGCWGSIQFLKILAALNLVFVCLRIRSVPQLEFRKPSHHSLVIERNRSRLTLLRISMTGAWLWRCHPRPKRCKSGVEIYTGRTGPQYRLSASSHYGRRWRDCQVVESQPNDSWTRERQSQRRFRYIFYFDLMAILHRASWSRTMNFKWTFKDSVNYMPTMEWLSKFKNVPSGNMKFFIWYTYSRNRLNFYTTLRTNPADQIFIFFSEERSVGVKTMRK